MATKIRLQRKGKKGRPVYHIVIADSRAKRDGKYIERIGQYNPNTNPATIDFDMDRAVHWLQVGAQPTDTCRAMLSYKGAIYKNHLLNGVRKGALTEEQVEKKFEAWLKDKEAKVQKKIDAIAKEKQDLAAAKLKAEKEYKAQMEKKIAEKLAPPPAAEAPAETSEPVAEAKPEEAKEADSKEEEQA